MNFYDPKNDGTILLMSGLAALIVLLAFWITASYFEAQSFNRVTGSHVSTWEAMFVRLQVQEKPKER